MMLLMKHIFLRMMYRTAFMSAKVQEPARSSLEVSQRMQDLQVSRLGATVIPKDLKSGDVMLHSLWARRHGTKYNGAPYIVQRAGEAVYSEAGKAQLKEQIAYYMKNAKTIKEGLRDAGYTVSGGVNAPYIWLEVPQGDDILGFL